MAGALPPTCVVAAYGRCKPSQRNSAPVLTTVSGAPGSLGLRQS
jgi:hypothetical protein